MKPKTKIQKEVARLSANLRPISATQIDWAYRHCVEHIGYRTKKGNITCSDCGHEWHSDSGLCDTLEGCTCPKCHAELKVQDTRRRIYKETQNFSVITTCKGYQVIRVAQVRCESRKGEPMRFYCHEVVQRWISPDGKVTDMALLRGFLFCYCDVWALGSDMEVRPHNSLYDDVVARSCAYPKMRILPQLRRNGFKGDFHGISPVRLFKALLSDPRIETLMKGGEIEVMKHFLFNTRTADECWASYLIAKRHKYQIDNLSMWCDYLRMLKKLGQDLRNPKNICPEDFMAAHDNATRKIEAIHEKERAAEQRRWEIERREREQQRQLQRKKDAEDFIANKSKFFGLVITDEEIIVKVLESIDEYYNEGKTQGICVFGSGYYKKADTLILSARIGDEIIETVEVDLRTLEVVQCHGKHNQDTEYHERIIDLVNKNANLIRERMKAAYTAPPLYDDDYMDLTPVDYAAAAIIHIAFQPDTPPGTYHVCNPQPILKSQIWDIIRDYGFPVRTVPAERYLEEVLDSDDELFLRGLQSVIVYLGDYEKSPAIFDASETLRRLKGSGISCPPPDPALLRRYLDYCVDIGFLPHPSTLGGLEWS